MPKLRNIKKERLPSLGVNLYPKLNFIDERGVLRVDFEGVIPNINTSLELAMKWSESQKGVGRGLHLQGPEAPQTKIINVVKGSIIDFLYDPSSDEADLFYFELGEVDNLSIVIPPNLAHGFITLTPVVFQYLCVGRYSEVHEQVFSFLPSAAVILGLKDIVLSPKDSNMPALGLSGSRED